MQGAALRRCYSSLLAQMPGRHAEGSEAFNFADSQTPKKTDSGPAKGASRARNAGHWRPPHRTPLTHLLLPPFSWCVFWSRPWPPASGPSRPEGQRGRDTALLVFCSVYSYLLLLPCAPGCIAAVPLGVASKPDQSSSSQRLKRGFRLPPRDWLGANLKRKSQHHCTLFLPCTATAPFRASLEKPHIWCSSSSPSELAVFV